MSSDPGDELTFAFDGATQVRALGEGRYLAPIRPGWDIGGNANGGYLMALVARAMLDATGREHPVSMTMHFLAPGTAGDAVCETSVLKSGRRFATASASLVRDGRAVVAALGTFGVLPERVEPVYSSMEAPQIPAFEDCRPRGEVHAPALTEKLDVRIHPDDTGFAGDAPTGEARIRSWFAFADGRPVDALALLLAVDALPPVAFNVVGALGWMPTLELTVHLRGVPAEGPVLCDFRSRLMQGGLWEESGEIWDSDGRCVAMSRQLALSVL